MSVLRPFYSHFRLPLSSPDQASQVELQLLLERTQRNKTFKYHCRRCRDGNIHQSRSPHKA
jgi:hypothetical protein